MTTQESSKVLRLSPYVIVVQMVIFSDFISLDYAKVRKKSETFAFVFSILRGAVFAGFAGRGQV